MAPEKTLIIVPHYGSDDLVVELVNSAGLPLTANSIHREATLISRGALSFLIVNNNTVNRGFTAACNLGLQHMVAAADGYSFAWLLNNDTAFESQERFERSLVKMQALARERDWSMVAQQVLHYSLRDQIVFGGSHECFPAGRHKSGLRSRGDWALPCEEKWLSFCSVLIRRDLVEKIGLMDESFVNYYSDSDYSLEARKKGYRIGYSGGEAYVFHKIGQSSNPGEQQQRVLRQDYMAFWKKWIAGGEHQAYMRLMGNLAGGGDEAPGFTATNLLENAPYPELSSWLKTLPVNQTIELRDILEHFQHQAPITPFTILCNIARELTERR